MDLNTAANLAEVLGALIVLGGVAFAILQLQQFRVQRRAQATLEVVRLFQTAEFVRALRIVLNMPKDMTIGQCNNCPTDFEDAAMLVSLTLESVGLMMHRRMVSQDVIWELMGGVTLEAWQRLRTWSIAIRQRSGRQKFNEWAQWLAERLEQHSRQCCTEPAYEKYADWKPRSGGPLA